MAREQHQKLSSWLETAATATLFYPDKLLSVIDNVHFCWTNISWFSLLFHIIKLITTKTYLTAAKNWNI